MLHTRAAVPRFAPEPRSWSASPVGSRTPRPTANPAPTLYRACTSRSPSPLAVHRLYTERDPSSTRSVRVLTSLAPGSAYSAGRFSPGTSTLLLTQPFESVGVPG